MSSVRINPTKHVVRETPTAKIFRRKLRFDDVFTYFNTDTGQWILAYWMNKKARIADEIEDLGPAFELVTPELIQQIASCWGFVDWKAKKKLMLQREANQIRKENEKIMEQQERYDWLADKLQDKSPIPYGFKAGKFTGGEVTTQ